MAAITSAEVWFSEAMSSRWLSWRPSSAAMASQTGSVDLCMVWGPGPGPGRRGVENGSAPGAGPVATL